MTDITMPALTDSMEQGLLLQWLIADGQEVEVGDELVEIETDKATMTYAAEAAGRLQIVVPKGTTASVGEVIARVGARVEEPVSAAPEPVTATVPENAGSNGHGARRDAGAATPVARRLAEIHGIELEDLEGSGPRGRVTKADVMRAAGQEVPERPFAVAPLAPAADTRELTRTQQLIAKRMTEAKSTIPHFQVQTEVAINAALTLRAELKAAAVGFEPDAAPSVNDLIVKAAALALAHHPLANGSYRDGRFELHERINVGVAVAADGALVVPTVLDAAGKTLGQIARETRRLAERVRTNRITPPELAGATFTVSNLGMFRMTAITPVINPPQAAILGVGAVRETLARVDGEIVDRSVLTLTLSCDHRILYGADAARFLAEIRDLLEAPKRLLL